MVKLAYCLLAHKNPKQVHRVIERLMNPQDCFCTCIFNSPSQRNRAGWENYLGPYKSRAFRVRYGYSNGWGNYEMVKATLDAMAELKDVDYDYFINLSGQCYPIKRVDRIRKEIAKNEKTIIHCVNIPEGKGRGRISNRFDKWNHYFDWKYLRFGVHLPRIFKKWPDKFIPYYGSQWFCMRREHVDYVLDFCEGNQEFVNFFKGVGIPDEHFFQTILMNSPHSDKISNRYFRLLNWPKGFASQFALEDFEYIQKSEQLFARKFDTESDAALLDLIDREIIYAAY